MPPLTSRERVHRALERRDHDRIPRHDGFWLETIDRWRKEGLPGSDRDEAAENALARLESDFQMLSWYWPHPFPGRKEVIEEDEETRVTIGESGTIERFWKNKSGTPEHLGWECDSREKWERLYKPAFLAQSPSPDLSKIEAAYQKSQDTKKWTYLAGVEAFECIRKLIGDEAAMFNVIDDPEWIVDLAKVTTDRFLLEYQAVLDAGIRPDGLWVFGDMAFNTMTFCSPQAYRELIWPEHKRIADFAKVNQMKVIYHTDGDVNGVIDLYLEAGFDCLQPLESKARMDVRQLAPRWGDRLSFFGNIDVMKLITNDLAVIEDEVASKLAAVKPHNGYIYHSDHSVPPQVSWKTYQALIGMLQKYGNY